jgi:hypothetical protein
MLRTLAAQVSLWEAVLPAEVLRLPEELARVDALLEDPVFFAPFMPFFDPRVGRPSTPMETYLRMMFLKFRYRLVWSADTGGPHRRSPGQTIRARRRAAVLVARTRSERQRSAELDHVHLVQRWLPGGAAAVGVAGQQPLGADAAGEGATRMGEQPGAAGDVRVFLDHRAEQAAVRVRVNETSVLVLTRCIVPTG